MNLDKKSLQAIGEIVDDKIKKAIDDRVPKIIDEKIKNNNKVITGQLTKTFTKEIGFLRLEINQRFDQHEIKNQAGHKIILQKIEEIKQMENEDILALSDDVIRIKKHVGIK